MRYRRGRSLTKRNRVTSVRRQSCEDSFHIVNARDIHTRFMVAAGLPAGEAKTAPRVTGARPRATEMNDGGQVLFLLQRRSGDVLAAEDIFDLDM